MAVLLNERGSSRLKVFLWFVALFLAVHVGSKIIPVYMDFERMKDEMTVKAGVAQVLKDEEILRDLENKAKDLDLPLRAENFILTRNEDRRKMKISTAWVVDVQFFGGAYIRSFYFKPEVEQSYMSVFR